MGSLQEVKAYQAKLRELENRQHLLIGENDELKRLCLYLDEQRQSILLSKVTKGDQTIISRDKSSIKNSNDSNGCDSSGCGSSTGSQRGSEDEEDSHSERDKKTSNYDDKQVNFGIIH